MDFPAAMPGYNEYPYITPGSRQRIYGDRGMRVTVKRLGILACLLAVAGFLTRASAEDAIELLREREGARVNNVNVNYRQMMFSRVLSDMEKKNPGINLKIKAPTFTEMHELEEMPVTLGPLTGVSWDTALRYIADSMRLVIDRSQIADSVIYLEKVARFTDTFDGVRLGEAVREIAKRGNANIIFPPPGSPPTPRFSSPSRTSRGRKPWKAS